MRTCKCEHWAVCPVCKPEWFDNEGNRLPPEPTPLQVANGIIAELRQQLAAALAACKQKDEALDHMCFNTKAMETYDRKLVKEALAIQPDDSALKVWLGEPVGWYNGKDGEYGYDTVTLFEDIAIGSNLYKPKGIK